MVREQYSVAGETTIITGASQGLGRSMAENFAHDGADVVVSSRSQEKLDDVASDINGSDADGRVVPIECDVTEREAVDALVEETVAEFGTVDVMINNAGASFMADVEEISENGWKTIVDINLTGTFHGSQAAGAVMRDGDGGAIINLSSVAGLGAAPQMSHYAAAKAGITNFTETLAYEWAPQDIRVNCIAPGVVATPGVASQMGITADKIDRDEVDRRLGKSDEIADLAQFLASPAASFINGETITARGRPLSEEAF